MSAGRAFALRWLVRLYGWALRFYPQGARREYAGEMQAVFFLKAQDAARQSRRTLVCFACREARDFPRAVVSSYLDERKAMMKRFSADLNPDAPLTAWKIALVFLPFVLALIFSLHNHVPETLVTVLGLPLLGLLIATWIAGLVKTFPVWALPSLGLLFFFIYFFFLKLFVQANVYDLYGGWPDDFSMRIRMLLTISLGLILVVAVVLYPLLRLLPKFTDRLRQDWTLLSFLLYGLAIMPLFVNDEFTHLWEYQIAGLSLLALGAGLYLIVRPRWGRILALLVPVVLSQGLLILGLYQTYPLEPWSLGIPDQRIWEALQPLSDPLPLLLLLPALVPLLPKRDKPEPIPSEDPTFPPDARLT